MRAQGGPGGGASSAEARSLAAPRETARIVVRDLTLVVSDLASLKGEVYWDLERRHEHRALAPLHGDLPATPPGGTSS